VATRALALVARHAFDELGADRVQLTTEPNNLASQRVAEKAGFTREGVLRSLLEFKGRRRDAVMFSLLPEDV
jgi:RimJ/RimL family protein N-acetyltransferase